MKSCQDGVKILATIVTSNTEIVTNYNNKLIEWGSKKTEHNKVENGNKTWRDDQQNIWDNERDTIKDELAKEKKWAGRGCNNAPGCPGGWQTSNYHIYGWSGRNVCNEFENECKRTNQTSKDDADTEMRKRRPRPSDYNISNFSEEEPKRGQQISSDGNLICCSNISNIVGSNITDSTISQENSCKETSKSIIKNLEKEYSQKRKEEDENKIKIEASQKEVNIAQLESGRESDNTIMYISIAVAVCICSIILVLVLLLLYI
jgi:hypothetical protein